MSEKRWYISESSLSQLQIVGIRTCIRCHSLIDSSHQNSADSFNQDHSFIHYKINQNVEKRPVSFLYLDQDQKIIRSSPGRGIKNKFMVVKKKLRQKAQSVCIKRNELRSGNKICSGNGVCLLMCSVCIPLNHPSIQCDILRSQIHQIT